MQSFKKLKDQHQVDSKALEIFQAYFGSEAPFEINVSYSCKQELDDKFRATDFHAGEIF